MRNIKELLTIVSENKKRFTDELVLGNGERVVLRPLVPEDVQKLARFLERLSVKTREQSTFSSYDIAMAQELCEAINRYDKLRFVLENSCEEICGLFEFSLDIPESDVDRFNDYGITLGDNDCRWGITIADDYQNFGVGKLIFPFMVRVVKGFGYARIILYGGVLASNERAIHYYEKLGFKEVGRFVNQDEIASVDMVLDLS